MTELLTGLVHRLFWRRRNIVIAVVVALVLSAVVVRAGAALTASPRAAAPVPHRPRPTAAAPRSPLPSSAAPSPAASPGSSGSPSASPVPSPPVSATAVNVYQWLPFSQAGLTSAAREVTAFAHDYATYTYTESPAAYATRMKDLVTPALAASLARSYATPGVAQQRRQDKQSQTSHGRITALRAFGTSSITFVVTVVQDITGHGATGRSSISYAITVGRAGHTWRVTDIELATAGNP